MKLLLTIMVMYLSLCCVQIVCPVPQLVKARKADPHDTRKVTLKITDTQNELISESTFKKDSTRFARKSTLHFDFEGNRDVNIVTAYYNEEPYNAFGIIVSREEAPEGSEIVINGKMLSVVRPIGKQKVSELEPETFEAELKIVGPGIWDIVTGSMHLTSRIAFRYLRTKQKRPEVLQHVGEYSTSNCGFRECKVLLYKWQPTRIYTFTMDLSGNKQENITTLRPGDALFLLQGESVITIDTSGKANVISRTDYGKHVASQPKT